MAKKQPRTFRTGDPVLVNKRRAIAYRHFCWIPSMDLIEGIAGTVVVQGEDYTDTSGAVSYAWWIPTRALRKASKKQVVASKRILDLIHNVKV